MAEAPCILCIEDDAGTAELLAEELQEAGFRVRLAHSGNEGIAAMTPRPDLVLCDIDMPEMSGYDVLRKVRSLGGELRRLPFIFLTAFAARENQIRARELGCDDYLTKPIDFDLLVAAVRNRLNRTGNRDSDETTPRLSTREAEALTWAARGKSAADIAVLMSISERTANFHIDNVIRKLGVATRTQAAVKAALLGLIDP
jgi:DNA-binding NarL/FixJ family response regulator